MKRIIAISIISFFAVFIVNAQQANTAVASSKASTVNPNIERMLIVNEKIATERAQEKAPAIQSQARIEAARKNLAGRANNQRQTVLGKN